MLHIYLAYHNPQVPVRPRISRWLRIFNFKTYACNQHAAQLHAGNAQISRYPPHRGRDDRPNRSDALAA